MIVPTETAEDAEMKAIRKTGKQETAKPEQENSQSAVAGRATTPVGAAFFAACSDALGPA